MSVKSISSVSLQMALTRIAQVTQHQIHEVTGNIFFERVALQFGSRPAKFIFQSVADGDPALTEKVSAAFEQAQSTYSVKDYFNSLGVLQPSMTPFQEADALIALGTAAIAACPAFDHALGIERPAGSTLGLAAGLRRLMHKHRDLLRTVKALDLSGQKIRLLPPEIAYFSELQRLDLSRNEIRELPPALFELKQLKVLKAKSNDIKMLPSAIGELKGLETLILQGNLLEEVPEEIRGLSRLKLLNLASNRLSRLPEALCDCQALIYLYLDENELEELPGGIERLENLYGLYLYGNCLEHLPAGLFQLEELGVLAVSGNPLRSLPPEIARLKKLRYLTICDANLTRLPKEIGQLVQLCQLSIDSNALRELPEEMAALTKLKHFSFFENPLTHVPPGLKDLPFWSLDPQLYPRVEMIGSACLSKALSAQGFSSVYWRLGDKKWKEAIDGVHHSFGKGVYDQGLHDPEKKEPGYLASMESAFAFLSERWNTVLDANFYLQLHKRTCGHFKKEETATWIDQKMVGVFRNEDHSVKANMGADYELDRKSVQELEELNQKICMRFGPSFSLCEMVLLGDNPNVFRINYTTLKAEQVRVLFNFFVTELYYEIGHAKSKDEKRLAIARWFQYNEWLHPPVDGCGRTDVVLLNYLLTCYGFHPALLQLPYLSSCRTLEEWDKALEAGLKAWEEEDPNR